MVAAALFVDALDGGVVVAHLRPVVGARSPSKTTPPIGYSDRSSRGQRSRKNVE